MRKLCKEVGRPQTKRDRQIIEEIWGGAGSTILDYLFTADTIHRLFPERPRDEVRELLAIRWGKLSDAFRVSLFPGAKSVLARLKKKGLCVAIVTNAEAPRFLKNLSNRGINARHIDFSLSSTHGDRHSIGDLAHLETSPKFLVSPSRKPEPEFMKPLVNELKKRRIAPQECLFVGDTQTDAEAAMCLDSYFAPACYGSHSQNTAWWRRTLKRMGMAEAKIIGTPVSLRDVYELVMDFNSQQP